jgi:hypothetical protein
MKFWFSKQTPKEAYDGKAPYDATVEQVLRVVQEVRAAPAEAEREVFDFDKAMRPNATPTAPVAAPATATEASPSSQARPATPGGERALMRRRLDNYRAFQIKLNEEREARIRRTMDNLRAKLQQSLKDNPPH